jgi:hypothetical protein
MHRALSCWFSPQSYRSMARLSYQRFIGSHNPLRVSVFAWGRGTVPTEQNLIP